MRCGKASARLSGGEAGWDRPSELFGTADDEGVVGDDDEAWLSPIEFAVIPFGLAEALWMPSGCASAEDSDLVFFAGTTAFLGGLAELK